MTKILTNTQGKVLLSSDGAYKSNYAEYLEDSKAELENYIGTGESIADADMADTIASLNFPMFLEVGATTIRYDATHTENIASNNHIKIYGNDNKAYTLAEWNAMFVESGYDKAQMAVVPIGIQCDYLPNKEVYLFDIYDSVVYNPVGDSAATAGQLQHSLYNHTFVTAAGNGTDSTTNKAWTVTASGDNLVLYEANTKQSWTIAKNTGNSSKSLQAANLNIADRTYSIWAQTEWMRHRMAISSGVSTAKPDGTMGEIQILNSSGVQAAANEEMYFWVKNDSDVLANTNKLAKYNLNNRHTSNSVNLTQAIADAIYNRQKANGINMNDTGVNSSSKPILAPGSKGAELIAVDGYWMIITPYITNPNATTTTATNNMADSPAVYWAIQKGYCLPSEWLLFDIYRNKTLYDAIITYLKNREGRTEIAAMPTSAYMWTSVRQSATYCWGVYLNYGVMYLNPSYIRYFVVGASAS